MASKGNFNFFKYIYIFFLMLQIFLSVFLRHLVCTGASLTPTLQFSCCGISELSQPLCGWLELNLLGPAGAMLTCTLFLLNTPKPGVNTLLLCCCRHHTELFTRGGKNRDSSISRDVYRALAGFSTLENASLTSVT